MSDDTREKFINYVALQLKECLEHLDSCYSWAVPLPRLNVKGFVESKEQRFGRFVESLASSVHGLNHVNDVIAMRRIFSIYAREIGLVCEELKASTDISNDQQMFLSYVVEGWGKVNVNKSNSDKNGYINLLNKIELNDGCGDRISSWSKILAAIEPQNYFVYDSRVSYALNVLWIKCFSKIEGCYFPLLPTRNAKLGYLYQIKLISVVKDKQRSIKKSFQYKNDYCDLIIKLAKILSVQSEPQKIEMSLFMFVGTKVFRDMANSLPIE